MLCSRGRCSLCWAVPPGLKPGSLANASVRDVGHLLPSRVRISPVLFAEEKFLPSGKLQPVGEPLCLFICKKAGQGAFCSCFVSSQRHPYLSKMFLLMRSADKSVGCPVLQTGSNVFLVFLLITSSCPCLPPNYHNTSSIKHFQFVLRF